MENEKENKEYRNLEDNTPANTKDTQPSASDAARVDAKPEAGDQKPANELNDIDGNARQIDKTSAADEKDKQQGQQMNDKDEDGDDDVATPEEIEAFLRDRRQQKEQQKLVFDNTAEDAKDMEQIEGKQDVTTDPYMEPDPEVPHVVYNETPFLWRGCNHCPTSYEPISSDERHSCSKLAVCNWLEGIHQPQENPFDCVEVRFKNNRKEFYRLPYGISVTEGDVVAVDGTPGHDVGVVSLTGELCRIQMQKKHADPTSEDVKKLFRRAKVSDIEKWAETIKEEHAALIKTRKISEDLGLVMKMNDVEFQGDRSKAIFYYTADDRVDFRALIRILAEEFHVRVEMKQIGVRQEASKVGGLGTCGRELCCSTWLTNFKSVTTSVAKTQQILPNPQKLAGQCGKLKCCLNFEYEVYVDALKKFPPSHVALRFKKGLALYKKIDVFRGVMWYAYEGQNDLYAIPADSVKEIIDKNRNQVYPEQLEDYQVELMSTTALEQETSESEFEQAIKQLADTGNEVVNEDDNRRDRQRNRDDRSNYNRDDRSNYNRGDRSSDRGRRSDDRGDRRDDRNSSGDRRERPFNGDRRDRREDSGERRERRDSYDRRRENGNDYREGNTNRRQGNNVDHRDGGNGHREEGNYHREGNVADRRQDNSDRREGSIDRREEGNYRREGNATDHRQDNNDRREGNNNRRTTDRYRQPRQGDDYQRQRSQSRPQGGNFRDGNNSQADN